MDGTIAARNSSQGGAVIEISVKNCNMEFKEAKVS